MLKGSSTLKEYDECLNKGLCEEHLKELKQNDVAALKNEFPRKVFKFVRVNVLLPFLCNKPPKCEKMKKLMQKTPPIAKCLFKDSPDWDISEEAANVILTMDSVVVFTICQLSKICCIGAVFHTKKNSNDAKIKALQNLLVAERLNNDIRYLYPVLQNNFTGCNLDVIRASHCITLLFVRKFYNKLSLKTAIEAIEKDISTNCDFDKVTVVCSKYNYRNMSCVVQKTSTLSSALFNFYSSSDYMTASEYYFAAKNYDLACFYGFFAVSLEDSGGDAYYPYVKALIIKKLFKDAFDVITYGIKHAEENSKHCQKLTKLLQVLSKRIGENRQQDNSAHGNSALINVINQRDMNDKPKKKKKEQSKSGLVDLVDSDSSRSDSENINEESGPLLQRYWITDSCCFVETEKPKFKGKEEPKGKSPEFVKENSVPQETKELKCERKEEPKSKSPECVKENSVPQKNKELKSERKEKPKSKSPECVKENSVHQEDKELKSERKEEPKRKSPECVKENSVHQDAPKLPDVTCSDDESETKKKKQVMNGTKEKTKMKTYAIRRKRTISEGSVDNHPDEEMDINKINSYLKEASEALLADCGYKAVQIFRGPIRKFMESSDFLLFEECEIVCIKYSYGIAYCKSGGHDDLEKCISILKDIIENHDSITFPAAYYSLGLASRKLNRFKEALNYLEIVQNFLEKGIHFKVYPWPGMSSVIQETKPDILKDLVQDLIKECENPPNPDAFCRYKNCSFQPTIYYTDPDFKGYISLSCSEQCNLQYHMQCWKIIKEDKNLTDKEFLEKLCFTPDCEGFIAKIQNIDKKGDLSKEFASEFKRPQKVPKKWEKKTDVKEKEKRKKKTSIRSEGGSQEILAENGKESSRKSSVCDNETTESKTEHSRKSSVCENETAESKIEYSRKSSVCENETAESKIEYSRESSVCENETTESKIENSRESSICDSETTENKIKYSRESSICDNETTSQLSDFCISTEEIPSKPEFDQKSSENITIKAEVPVSSDSNCASSSPQETSYADFVESFEKLGTSVEKTESELEECIKHNTYSYMADFLRLHGPVRIDDPLLTSEIESFPDETYNIISKSGGIGEFLKNDLEFAFVGDLYVCVVDDLAKAYQMLSSGSLPTDFKNFQSLESSEDSKYYHEDEAISDAKHSSFLNPDAQEYTPSSNKSSSYNLATNSSHPEDIDSHCSLPLNLESSYKCTSSISELDTFPGTEMFVSKSKSCEAFSNGKLQNKAEPVLCNSYSKEKSSNVTNESENKYELCSDVLNKGSEMVDESSLQDSAEKNIKSLNDSGNKSFNYFSDGSPTATEDTSSKCKKIEAQLLHILNKYFSEEMTEYHHTMISSLKPYVVKKMAESVSTSTMTDIKFQQLEENENSSTLTQDLKKEISILTDVNASLQNALELSNEQKGKLTAEVIYLKSFFNDANEKFENMKKDFEKKEKDFLKEKKSLVQCLTDANKFVGKVQQKNASMAEEKIELQKTVDSLTLSIKKEEEKMKNALDVQEKKFNAILESLRKENAELKNRTKHAELQVLYMKKTEYLKRLEAKALEVIEVNKEMNSPSMQLWANAAGPEQMKILSTKLNNYADELEAIRRDFVEKIDEQIKKVKYGASLKDLKEVVMKDLAPVPTYKSILPEHLLSGMSKFNPMTMPYFGTPAIVPPVPTASSFFSPATSALKIVPPSAVSAKMISPASPANATKIIPPMAPASKVISPAATNVISSVTSAATIIPPSTSTSLSSSVPPVLNKENKIDLVNDIDPTIQESFKNAMASINSYASSLCPVPSLDDEFDKNCVVFKHPDPVSNDSKIVHPKPKVPPGLVNSVPTSASVRASAITPIPEPVVEASKPSGSFAGLDTVPKINVVPNQRAWEPEKKKITASYSKLLDKLKEQFPTYSSEELLSYVKDVRTQRQGKLTGLTIDAIISEIGAIMNAKKKMSEVKVQPKPAKVLVNKKLVPDPKPPVEPQTTKKKPAWNIDADAAQRRFSGSADDDCTICCDSMANSPYKVACGHFFHEECIRQWLKKNSNCPICRVLLLLPDEYPSLS